MTWRLEVRHLTGYRYEAPVTASYNEARVTPLSDPHQVVISSTVRTEPPSTMFRYRDYWGTAVTVFDLHRPHDELAVTALSLVETEEASGPGRLVGWDEVRSDDVRDRFGEYLAATDYVLADPELASIAAEIGKALTPAAAVAPASRWVHGQLDYEPGVTGVHTSAREAWAARRGVCQDFAHLTLALLRAIGVPCRYVSGYLHPQPDAAVGDVTRGESHAWIEAWTGDWWGYDPTNLVDIGPRHVLVARGRDYADVAPLHGLYSGGASSALGVEVEITRVR